MNAWQTCKKPATGNQEPNYGMTSATGNQEPNYGMTVNALNAWQTCNKPAIGFENHMQRATGKFSNILCLKTNVIVNIALI